ncbi:uncharacterized protein LOC130891977 [Diorhabda carinulata]|uniref:uncharacterized protein LOC130891977 n=1 Tax=Diorhabda carinulata TaxID=1163345 RepID=UPI0025A1C0C7|nr:uncharacterized protein LOC130891977 [Diorhabda carinulata]
MKTQIFVFFSSLVVVLSASIPLDDNSSLSSVKVNQNGNEYSYTIKDGKALGLEPLPIIPIIESVDLNGKPGQPILVTALKKEDIQEKNEIIQDKENMKLMEPDQSKVDEEKLKSNKITDDLKELNLKHENKYEIISGYRLIPANNILLEYPFYHPYFQDYAYHYPHLRLF